MRKSKLLVIAIVLISGLMAGTRYYVSAMEREKKNNDDLYRNVELFADTLAIIQNEYVDETKPKDLIYGSLKGMLSALDPHSQFMDPDTYNELKVDTEGKFGGLGIEITLKDGLLTVVTPIEDTPAWKVGLKSNDRIVKIDNELTRDMSLSDAVKRLRGKPMEPVNITVLRESENRIIEFKIVRDIIKIKDIKEALILEDGIAYIRLVEFRENTSQDITEVLNRLKEEGMNALILDLRNNPGGLLDVAVKVTERFIKQGEKIVFTKGRKAAQNFEFYARASRPVTDIPMAILINEGSASGSEIVAGCLKDYKRAIIIGKKSFGKGSVQTVIPLSDGSALRLTTSKYFTPLGNMIHGKGVEPNIEVDDILIVETPAAQEQSMEKSKEIFEKLEEKNEKEEPPTETQKPFEYKNDNQLMRAVDVLKGIKFYKQNN
ncbi:MAG: S41 family peptidase [Candidatus Omnitrophica bacterium]|nr:S41 family peptidase [Candidatus Omnitrophota bacterium]